MSIRLLDRAADFSGRVAIRDRGGEHRFAALSAASERRARALLGGRADLDGERVAYLQSPGFDHVATQWAIWRAGAIAVPLGVSHPAPEMARILADATPSLLIADEELGERAREAAAAAVALIAAEGGDSATAVPVTSPTALDAANRRDAPDSAGGAGPALPHVEPGRRALMVYTSGTTGHPKGVVTTHANLEAQITTLVDAWEWASHDRILHVLPLHHIHGIVNALCCALWAGACCEFSPPDPAAVWERLATGEITVFMGVPTVYGRLINAWEQASDENRGRWSAGAANLRLAVSGSAPLPVQTLQRWEEIGGERLLERYGMTEIGMALGNPLRGERRPGTVGVPFRGVEARLVDDDGARVPPGEQGQIEVRGAQVFEQYWNRPRETATSFTADGWFRTGDDAVIEDGYWKILGRRSVDIIKSGGYKISALEIEGVLREYPCVADVAVVGVADDDWGERVCAALVARPGAELDPLRVRAWCKKRLAPYKVPKQVAVLTRLPRNALGKVVKPALQSTFASAAE
jgi:malonyl-CoA/methylmalonyl-CoA synthetase